MGGYRLHGGGLWPFLYKGENAALIVLMLLWITWAFRLATVVEDGVSL